jgi:hypothetical protein
VSYASSSHNSSSSSYPTVNLYFNVASSSDGKKHVREGSNQQVPLIITRSGGSTSQYLTVLFGITGTATAGSDYTAQGSFTIPAGATSTTYNISIVNDDMPEPTESITATLWSAYWYSIGSNGADTVYILDNDIKVTNLTYEFELMMQLDGGEFPMTLGSVTNSGTIAKQALIECLTSTALSNLASLMADQIISEFTSSLLTTLGWLVPPSFWIGKMNKHIQLVGIQNCKVTITYDKGNQTGLTHLINGSNNSTTCIQQLITLSELLYNTTKQNAITTLLESEATTATNSLRNAAINWLNQQFLNYEIHGMN